MLNYLIFFFIMTDLITVGETLNAETMTSLQIAEITGKEP